MASGRSFFMRFIIGKNKSGLNWQYGGKNSIEKLKGADKRGFSGGDYNGKYCEA